MISLARQKWQLPILIGLIASVAYTVLRQSHTLAVTLSHLPKQSTPILVSLVISTAWPLLTLILQAIMVCIIHIKRPRMNLGQQIVVLIYVIFCMVIHYSSLFSLMQRFVANDPTTTLLGLVAMTFSVMGECLLCILLLVQFPPMIGRLSGRLALISVTAAVLAVVLNSVHYFMLQKDFMISTTSILHAIPAGFSAIFMSLLSWTSAPYYRLADFARSVKDADPDLRMAKYRELLGAGAITKDEFDTLAGEVLGE